VRITKKASAKAEPDPSREFTSGERRVALTRVYLKMTCPALDQSSRTELGDLIIALVDGKDRRSQQRKITDAQVIEMVWRHSQCVLNQTGRCPLLLFGKQLAEEINEFFVEEE
jgi:hypothetical protein